MRKLQFGMSRQHVGPACGGKSNLLGDGGRGLLVLLAKPASLGHQKRLRVSMEGQSNDEGRAEGEQEQT